MTAPECTFIIELRLHDGRLTLIAVRQYEGTIKKDYMCMMKVMTLTLQCDNVKSFIVTYKMMCFHLKARVDKIWN